MVRIGRIVLNEGFVSRVVKDKKAKTTTVTMQNGEETVFTKYADAAWNYFKGDAENVAGK